MPPELATAETTSGPAELMAPADGTPWGQQLLQRKKKLPEEACPVAAEGEASIHRLARFRHSWREEEQDVHPRQQDNPAQRSHRGLREKPSGRPPPAAGLGSAAPSQLHPTTQEARPPWLRSCRIAAATGPRNFMSEKTPRTTTIPSPSAVPQPKLSGTPRQSPGSPPRSSSNSAPGIMNSAKPTPPQSFSLAHVAPLCAGAAMRALVRDGHEKPNQQR